MTTQLIRALDAAATVTRILSKIAEAEHSIPDQEVPDWLASAPIRHGLISALETSLDYAASIADNLE